MSSPLFKAAVADEAYRQPDFDLIEREQDLVDAGRGPSAAPPRYQHGDVDPDELARIKEDMRALQIQITPANLAHAIEAEEIRKMLRRQGIRSLRKVSATRDYRGVVKLTFDEFRRLCEALLAEDPCELEDDAR